MQSTKIMMTLWVEWKTPVKSTIMLDPEDVEGAQYIRSNTGDNYIKVEMPFNSSMNTFFEGRDIEVLIKPIFAHINTEVENPRMPEGGYTLDQIMHLHINFQKLALPRGSYYVELPQGIKKKAMINSKNNNEHCFK